MDLKQAGKDAGYEDISNTQVYASEEVYSESQGRVGQCGDWRGSRWRASRTVEKDRLVRTVTYCLD